MRIKAVWSGNGFKENEALLAGAQKMGLSDVFIGTFMEGGAVYQSANLFHSSETIPLDEAKLAIKRLHDIGIKVHAWIVSLMHPEVVTHGSYVVNRNGVSCLEKAPYVPYYTWLCPSHITTRDFLVTTAKGISEELDFDGIHLDYIRYPDVFIPVGLRKKYGLSEDFDQYYPDLDYCYCDNCRATYKKENGVDPLSIHYGSEEWAEWTRWRTTNVVKIVDAVHEYTASRGLTLSAAVFAAPGLAIKSVLQDWSRFPLDIALPMIYVRDYGKDYRWAGEAVAEGVATGKKVVAGLNIGHYDSLEELDYSVKSSFNNGAAGVCFFSYPNMFRSNKKIDQESLEEYVFQLK